MKPLLWFQISAQLKYKWITFLNMHQGRKLPNSLVPSPQQIGAPVFLWWLVGVMAVIEIVLSAADAGAIGSPEWRWIVFSYGAFWRPIFSGEIAPIFSGQDFTMFVSHAFLHGNFLHFAMNCAVLLALGKVVANRIGTGKTIMAFLLSAVGGAAAFGLISTGNGPMIGASGAVFGLIGIWQAWDFSLRRRRNLPLGPVVKSAFALVLANILLFVVLSSGLAWEAHLGGWLVGVASAASFARV
jgi:membrane associated rhomboid family serine protease